MTAEAGIQALVFDYGGVFTRSEVSLELLRGYDRLLKQPEGTLHLSLYSGEVWELASTGKITPEEHWRLVGAPWEMRLPAEFLRFREGIFAVEPIDEEMVALAVRLHRRYPLALCSNALPDLSAVLDSRPDVRDLFDVVIISVLAGVRKPDPAMFRLAAEGMGLPPEACLLVDDKERNTAAAEMLGMPAIHFHSVAELSRQLAGRGLLPADDLRVPAR